MDRLREIAVECQQVRAGLRALYLPTEQGTAIADLVVRLSHSVEALAVELRETRVKLAQSVVAQHQ